MKPRLFIFILIFPISLLAQPFEVHLKSGMLAHPEDSVKKYQRRGEYEQALSFTEKWLEKTKNEPGKDSLNFAASLHETGKCLQGNNKWKESIEPLSMALKIRKKIPGNQDKSLASSYCRLGLSSLFLQKRIIAESYLLKSLELLNQNKKTDSIDFFESYYYLGMFYQYQKDFPKAEFHYSKAQKICREQNLISSDAAFFHYTFGVLYLVQGNHLKSEPLIRKYMEISEAIFGKYHPEVAERYHNLGNDYQNHGSPSLAGVYFLEALEIRKMLFPNGSRDLAFTYNNLANVYRQKGDYLNAVKIHMEALEMRKKLFGEVHSEVALSYSNLSNTYTALGDYTRALIFARKGLDIYLRTYGEIHWEVGFAYRNLGLAHEKSGDLLQAKACYKKSLEIRKKTRGEKFHEYATSLSDLGNIDFKMGNFSNSEKLHNQCIEIMTNTLHGNHPFFIQPYQNIGTIYSATGRHEQAKSTLRKALKLTEIHYGAYHPLMATFYSQLGSVCFDEGKLSEADVFFQKARQVDKEVLQRYFPTLSDKEAEDFYNSGENNRLINKAFLIETGKNNPLQRANLYNHLLFYKSLLLNTSARWKQRIKTSGDTKLFQQFVEWEKLQKSISKIITTETPENPQIIDSMVNAAERLEKDLSKRSENFAKKEDKKSRDWKEIQKVLNPGEAAIEMIRFRKYGINRWVTDTTDYQQKNYAVRGLTDTVQYAALIVTKNCIHPEMVILPNGNNLEGKWFHYYWNNIQQKQAESKSYPQFWEPISDKLKGIKKIWFSPDGVYHKINLNTLKNPKTGKLLSEEIELSLLGSTKDLLNLYPDESENRLACLLGNPDFSPGNSSNNSRSRSGPELYYFLKPNAGAEIPELPGSRAEVDSIAYLLQNKGWEVQQFAGKDASEDKVKDSYKPRVMLLSTHGFFRPDTSNESNPLVRSGLLLAGASKTLREGYSGHGEDGILTAYEAMNLNLDNTELVILSACETGLGEIKNGEGVYGLQRAFQVAGARNLIMSLWKVDDEVTQQLMVRFFRHWLSGKNKHNAFNMARNEIRLRHPEPYYWGGFVMLGK